MARTDTQTRPETARTAPDGERTLVVIDGGEPSDLGGKRVHARPRAEFLTQLLVSVDPTMRASRTERMRDATDRYAATLRRRA